VETLNLGIHLFRRDLRLEDNTALNLLAEQHLVIPIYILPPTTSSWTGPNRQNFLYSCLTSLDEDIQERGGKLYILKGTATECIKAVLNKTGAKCLSFNRDYDPHGRQTEDEIKLLCANMGVSVIHSKDRVLHEADEVLTKAKKPFTVFTPYYNIWQALPKQSPKTTPVKFAGLNYTALHPIPNTPSLVSGGSNSAHKRLTLFTNNNLLQYKGCRDMLTFSSSQLSQDMRFGTISPRVVFSTIQSIGMAQPETKENASKFISELAWREFFMALLWNNPKLIHEEFNERFKNIPWHNNKEALDKWKNAETGFPIIDAAMRELQQTGLMHNRARMITAMFLTKDLHINWREGEKWFMQNLMDGEIASNNGGWQWSAGTGADAAPYFRIQNPWLQTKRYDRNGEYIKKWLPELRDVPAVKFWLPQSEKLAASYPKPIIIHSQEKEITLAIFKTHFQHYAKGL